MRNSGSMHQLRNRQFCIMSQIIGVLVSALCDKSEMKMLTLLFHIETGMAAFSLITNRIANSTSDNQARQTVARLQTMRHVNPVHNGLNMPVSILIVIVFIASVSTAVIYPSTLPIFGLQIPGRIMLMVKVYERVSNVRALEYSNGVSPFALWTAYLMFDMQFIIIESRSLISH